MGRSSFWGTLLVGLVLTGSAAAQVTRASLEQRFDPTQDIGLDQNLGAKLPLEARFRDEAGRDLALAECFGERPVVLALVYYECPMLCTLVLNGMLRTFRALSLELGVDYDVVVISIDPAETPELAAAKKAEYLETLQEDGPRPAAAGGWHFLVGSQASIDAVAESIGFRYVFDERADEYAHASGLVVNTPAGVISRYLYGVEYVTRDLRLALVEASEGRVGSLADKALLLCFQYDPSRGEYGFAIMGVLRGGGVLTFVLIVLYVLRSLARERRARRALAQGGAA